MRKRSGNTIIRGHKVRWFECGRSSSRKYDSFCVPSDNGNLFDLVGVQREESVGVFEQHDGFCCDFAHESCVFGAFDGTFETISIEDLRVSVINKEHAME